MAMKREPYVPRPCWLWIPEFCKFAGVTPATFHRWEKSGLIPEGAVLRRKGTQPRVNASAVFPERFEMVDIGYRRNL